jgi:hypothetical protein
MINSKIPHDGEPSQLELPRCTRAFVQDASKLHRAGFSRETTLQILKHSDTVFEFVKIVGLLKFINIDDFVMESLIQTIWEEKP